MYIYDNISASLSSRCCAGEDACQVRKGSAPHALAALNSFVLALFDFRQVSNVKRQMRCLDASPLQAVRLLLKSLKEN
jgi:hypothetical protein